MYMQQASAAMVPAVDARALPLMLMLALAFGCFFDLVTELRSAMQMCMFVGSAAQHSSHLAMRMRLLADRMRVLLSGLWTHTGVGSFS